MSTAAGPTARRASPDELSALVPLGSLSPTRLRELAKVAVVEYGARGTDPLAGASRQGQSVFLLRGELLLAYRGGGTLLIVGSHGDGRHAINRRLTPLSRTRAITEVELVVVEDDGFDILTTFDQVAAGGNAADSAMGRAVRSDARLASGIFSLANLRHGVFAQLPPARIEELLQRFERVFARKGDVLVREGDEGDYYYVIESGRCRVERTVGGVKVAVADLTSGDAFGEEALASEARRNATVAMATDGELLRLGKADFDALLREPLLQRVSFAEGAERVARGALWVDVRYPSEYRYDRLQGAVNVPLNEVRNSFAALDPSRELVVYCQSGRRSSAAAFLFAQRGFRVSVLDGGLWAARPAAG
ncbi:MAG: cyclic nucleotide-binding domain-containing protein [Betaproteobacteria bacterium]